MVDTRSGTLFVVATPIGNLEDITLRAIRILTQVDLIACEDTRHSRKLLNHLGIKNNTISYYKEKEAERGGQILAKLQSGQDVALVSDAGTPAISDPGDRLVVLCQENDIKVVPVPGPSALTSLLSVAGLAQNGFTFLGFLPSKEQKRISLFKSLLFQKSALVFYESPKRITKTLGDILTVFGNRSIVIGRELTKLHEEIISRPLEDVLADLSTRPAIKGEFVVAIAGNNEKIETSATDTVELLAALRDQGLSMKDGVRQLANDLGLAKAKIYPMGLEIWQKK